LEIVDTASTTKFYVDNSGNSYLAGAYNTSGTTGGYKIDGNLILQASSTLSSLFVGLNNGNANAVTGTYNTSVGNSALAAVTTGSNNTALGYQSSYSNITGAGNTAVGYLSLFSNISGSNNTVNGFHALYNNISATNTTALGYQAGYGNGGNYANQGSVYLGYQTGYNAATSSDYNTLLGYGAGYAITTGANNIILGAATTTALGSAITTGNNNILIGLGVSNGITNTSSNQLNIGNLIFGTNVGTGATLSTGNIGIGTTTPPAKLSVTGTVCLDLNSDGACTDNTSSLSDERLKSNIATMTNALDTVMKLSPKTFNWNNNNQFNYPVGNATSVGFIAQQVEQVLPGTDLVETTSAGFKVLAYDKLVAVLAGAIQEITNISGQFKTNLIGWLADAQNGIGDIVSKSIHTDLLCVGSKCVNESQFGNMMQGLPVNGGGPQGEQDVSGNTNAERAGNWNSTSTEPTTQNATSSQESTTSSQPPSEGGVSANNSTPNTTDTTQIDNTQAPTTTDNSTPTTTPAPDTAPVPAN
jgi:hypothetical protein